MKMVNPGNVSTILPQEFYLFIMEFNLSAPGLVNGIYSASQSITLHHGWYDNTKAVLENGCQMKYQTSANSAWLSILRFATTKL
jgi:hypothetical protein